MKERPIIFSAPMVRALLDGRKTQTRRKWKMPRGCEWYAEMGGEQQGWFIDHDSPWWLHVNECCCPYGAPGDRLWVRETWTRAHDDGKVMYRADLGRDADTDAWEQSRMEGAPMCRWRPSIHMPRWASRITLEITDVRVQRLQEISEEDAIAEGVEPNLSPLATKTWWQGYREWNGDLMHQQVAGDEPPVWMIEPHKMRPATHLNRSAVDMFRGLWITIHGSDSWDANPWVWALTFRRVASETEGAG